MKEIIKSSHSKLYFIICCISATIICTFLSWILFAHPLNSDKTFKIKKFPKPTTVTNLAVTRRPEVIKANMILAPDYSLPPIQNDMAPVVYRLLTNQKIVFLGIDDGMFKDQSVIDIMQQNNIKASLFLTKSAISGNPDFFKQLTAQGSFVEDHTISHDTKMVTDEDYSQQKADICGMADYEELHYGRRPTLFRPPGGAYSDSLRQAAADCGMKAIITWVAKANGGLMQYQIGDKLRPGDVVLMHFRPEFASDMKSFVEAMKNSGLHTALLEDAI